LLDSQRAPFVRARKVLVYIARHLHRVFDGKPRILSGGLLLAF